MSITDYLLPKWKSGNPETRLRAVREMDTGSLEIIEEIATEDPDSAVRIEAVGKIDDRETLHRIVSNSSDVEVIKTAWKKLNSIYRNMILSGDLDIETQKSMLERINGDDVLASIACETDDAGIRISAIDRIYNQASLCTVAESNCGPKAGIAIVERLTDPENLRRLARNASNKKIRKHAEEKLAELAKPDEPPPSPVDRTETELEKLCAEIENTAVGNNPADAEARLLNASESWTQHDPGEKHPLRERFEIARTRVREEIAKYEAKERLVSELGKLCENIGKIDETMPDDAENLMNEAKREWRQTVEDSDADFSDVAFGELETRFENSCGKIERKLRETAEEQERHLNEIAKLEEHCGRMEEFAASASVDEKWEKTSNEWDALKNEWENLVFDSPDTLPLKERCEKASAVLAERREKLENEKLEEAEKQRTRLAELCETVERSVDAEKRSGLEKTVREAQQEWKEAGGLVPDEKEALDPRFNDACIRFFEKQSEYYEMLDWERWANLNQKTELCQAVEALAEKDATDNVATAVRKTQEKWKEIGPVAKDKSDEIWNRFRAACDAAYERCLAAKTDLHEQAESVANAPEESINWKNSGEKLKDIQKKWNSIGYLPHSMEKDLRSSFQSVCNDFFGRQREFFKNFDAERKENLKKKTALCEEAESLAESDEWTRTAGRLKELQRMWKETGPVGKKEGDVLWSRFQTACNGFFRKMKEEKPENLRKKERLCEQAEELVKSPDEDTDTNSVSARLIELQNEWKKIGPVPEDRADEIWARFRAPCDEFFSKRKADLKDRKEQQGNNQELKEALVAEAENLAESTEWKTAGERLKELQKSWKEIGPAPRKKEQELWRNFRKACDTFFDRRNRFFGEMDSRREENLKLKEELCVSLEVLARLVMPDKASEHGESVNMAEQLSLALDLKNEIVVPNNPKTTWDRAIGKVKKIQTQWKKIGPVPQKYDQTIWKRFRKAADLFYTGRGNA